MMFWDRVFEHVRWTVTAMLSVAIWLDGSCCYMRTCETLYQTGTDEPHEKARKAITARLLRLLCIVSVHLPGAGAAALNLDYGKD